MFITGTGMVCPVGLSAASACAAKRAGISALADLPYYDNAGEPIVGGTVPGLDWTLPRASRLLKLLTKGLTDLLNGQPDVRWAQVPLLVCLAEQGRPGGGANLAPSIVERVEEELHVQFHPKNSRAFPSGHTAGFEALREARDLLQHGRVPACLVCGVDSFVEENTLLWLESNFRLKTRANRDGAIPGEAAASALLQTRPLTGTTTEIVGLGFGKEKAHILSEKPLLGLGLTEAVRTALAEASLGMHEIDCRLSDVTGELYGFKELLLVDGRLMRVVRKREQPLWHWAEAIGDCGAAAGVAHLVLAHEAFRKGYAPGERIICMASAIPGDRAAAVLRSRLDHGTPRIGL
jgi:3-oxoacyl-[acyl-carrier-protein] synthase-1